MKPYLHVLILLIGLSANAQLLKIKDRKNGALTGSQFAEAISNTALTLKQRERFIYKTIKQGNIPQFYRQLVKLSDCILIDGRPVRIEYYTIPDYLAIGTDTDYFYCPITPALAQRVASKLKCSLPTRKMVDCIYRNASIKFTPLPIPPTPAMSTVPVFIKHNQMLQTQRDSLGGAFVAGSLVAGHKKDVIISNRIYNDTSSYHLVIYGWHKLNGKAIQPSYARHLNTWADYSHGIRLVQNKVWIDGKKMSVKKVLRSQTLSILLSDEGGHSKALLSKALTKLFAGLPQLQNKKNEPDLHPARLNHSKTITSTLEVSLNNQ